MTSFLPWPFLSTQSNARNSNRYKEDFELEKLVTPKSCLQLQWFRTLIFKRWKWDEKERKMILRKIGNRFSLWPTYPDDDTDDDNDDADVGHDISDDDDDSFIPMQRKRRSQGELAENLHLDEARTSINVLRLQFYRSPKGKTCSSSFLFQVFQLLLKL